MAHTPSASMLLAKLLERTKTALTSTTAFSTTTAPGLRSMIPQAPMVPLPTASTLRARPSDFTMTAVATLTAFSTTTVPGPRSTILRQVAVLMAQLLRASTVQARLLGIT